MAQLLQLVDILQRAVALGDFVELLEQPLGAHPAGGAFAAGLINREFQEELGDVHHAGVLVHDDQAAGTHHGADGDEVVIVDGGVDQARGDAAARGAAGLRGLELLAVRLEVVTVPTTGEIAICVRGLTQMLMQAR